MDRTAGLGALRVGRRILRVVPTQALRVRRVSGQMFYGGSRSNVIAMKLRFGKARHGWLPTTLEVDGRELLFDVSYLPYDFVGELVTALSGVLDAPGEYVARICEEPPEHDWRFESSDPSAVSFRVVSYPTGQRVKSEAKVRAETWGAPLDIVLPFWRGLRELASRARAEGFRSHWTEPFPFDALDRLTERVEHAQATPP